MKDLIDKHLKQLEENLAIDQQSHRLLKEQMNKLYEGILAKQGAVDMLKIIKKELEEQKDE